MLGLCDTTHAGYDRKHLTQAQCSKLVDLDRGLHNILAKILKWEMGTDLSPLIVRETFLHDLPYVVDHLLYILS